MEDIKKLKKEMNKVLLKYPKLSEHGLFETEHNKTEELLTEYCLRHFSLCRSWLSGIDKTKTIRDHYSSYFLKHLVEECTHEYVTNGSFIAAAVSLGFDLQQIGNEPNAFFNMSKKSIKNVVKLEKLKGNLLNWYI